MFSDESKLPELIDWIRTNTHSAVIVLIKGSADRYGDAHVLHWYNKEGEEWTQDKAAATSGAAAAIKSAAFMYMGLDVGTDPTWFSKLEWHFEDEGEALQAKLACG